jgi:predicted transposase/invertase (TIGR01784 family)
MNLDDDSPLPPLADPVVGAIFSDVEHAGLAVESLSSAVFAKDGITIGRIISVTPQSYHKAPDGRGVRIDIEAGTAENEYLVIEMQIYADPSMFQRNLLSASHIFADKTPEGTRPRDLVAAMPKVIAINIFNFNIREGVPGSPSADYLQPVKMLYAKPPHEAAFDNFTIYNIQLPKLKDAERDFSDPLYSWLYAIDTAQRERKSIEEVIKMTPELESFTARDAGFRQFCEQYKRVASDPQARREYRNWCAQMVIDKTREEMYRAQGRAEGILEAAKRLLAVGHTPEEVAKALDLPLADVKALL